MSRTIASTTAADCWCAVKWGEWNLTHLDIVVQINAGFLTVRAR